MSHCDLLVGAENSESVAVTIRGHAGLETPDGCALVSLARVVLVEEYLTMTYETVVD